MHVDFVLKVNAPLCPSASPQSLKCIKDCYLGLNATFILSNIYPHTFQSIVTEVFSLQQDLTFNIQLDGWSCCIYFTSYHHCFLSDVLLWAESDINSKISAVKLLQPDDPWDDNITVQEGLTVTWGRWPHCIILPNWEADH